MGGAKYTIVKALAGQSFQKLQMEDDGTDENHKPQSVIANVILV
jgi:hypothetical protein